jgi:hypothetical protein
VILVFLQLLLTIVLAVAAMYKREWKLKIIPVLNKPKDQSDELDWSF